ncbi:hypothetical protein FACS1894166_13140 [Bacilli bacterium]|nr:hypothetical protein FACS1894166_13140 [Bacilli bacterium]
MKRNKKIKTIRSILIGLVTIGTVVGATWSLTACGSSDEKDKHTITIKGLHDQSLTVGHALSAPFE